MNGDEREKRPQRREVVGRGMKNKRKERKNVIRMDPGGEDKI